MACRLNGTKPLFEPMLEVIIILLTLNTLRPRQNGRHFADDMFKCFFLNENVWIPIEISLKFVPKGSINNIPALVQIMAWRRPGDKSLSEPMMIISLTHICVTRPQWVKCLTRPQWVILGIEALALAEERSFGIMFGVRLNRTLKNIRVLINFRRHDAHMMSL